MNMLKKKYSHKGSEKMRKIRVFCSVILVITYHFKIGKPNFLSQNPNNFINRPQACHKKYTQKPEPHKY